MGEYDKWLLPEGINEILPEQAVRLEHIRRRSIDIFNQWGYRLVMPPLAEYLESFLLNEHTDLQVQTFKVTDQASGRMLGIRSDMTPQIARIDAHSLRSKDINRLCYVGEILNTRASGVGGSRSPIQIGAEIYGHKGIQSDLEILQLMLELFKQLQIKNVHLVLGHIRIYSVLIEEAGLNKKQRKYLSELMRSKAKSDIKDYLDSANVAPECKEKVLELVDCYGEFSILSAAKEQFSNSSPELASAFNEIQEVGDIIAKHHPDVTLHCDLLEAPGYDYEDGLVFSAYTVGLAKEIARGGRYDGIGQVFGRARPAIGFSSNLEMIANMSQLPTAQSQQQVYAPRNEDPTLQEAISQARSEGKCVVIQLDDNDDPALHHCTHIFCQDNGVWVIKDC